MNSKIKYIKKNFDQVIIVSTLAKLTYNNLNSLNVDEALILKSLKRANPQLENKNLDAISEYLQELDEDQLLGLSNNVKGILHEIQFIEIENNDGDNITASLFTDSNHPDTDVVLTNNDNGEVFEVQLKATDSSSYVNDWIDNHQNGEILITDELAEKMELETSGISNDELTADVNEFIEKIIELDDNNDFWDYMPELPAISIAITGFYLFKKYKDNEISYEVLKSKFIRLTGMKIAKFAIISGLMLIPVVNVIIGAGILYNLLNNAGKIANKYVP
jgi:hypothetical protein